MRNLVLFHHDPDSSDRVVDGFLSAARQEFPATWAATEGMSITLSERGVDVDLPNRAWDSADGLRFSGTVSGQTEDGVHFEEKATVRDISLQGAYLSLKSRPRLQSELRVVIEASRRQNQSSQAFVAGNRGSLRRRTRKDAERRRRHLRGRRRARRPRD